MKRILIIGPAPGHIGGISIHIQRLSSWLINEYKFNYVDESKNRIDRIFNLRTLNLFKYIKAISKADVVHIQSGVFVLRIFHVIISKILFRKKTVVTVHRNPVVEGKYALSINKFILGFCDHVVLVNQIGLFLLSKAKVHAEYHLMHAFIPPKIELEKELPRDLLIWLKSKRNKGINIIVSNAWNLVLYNNQDLYGLDMCLDVMDRLIKEQKKIALIFVLASVANNKSLLLKYKQLIDIRGMSQCVYLYEKPLSFVRLIQQADIVVRPTNTDGDALSIREALFFGKKVIASDVVERPINTIIFKNRNIEDFYTKIIYSLRLINTKIDNNSANKYLDFYRKLYN